MTDDQGARLLACAVIALLSLPLIARKIPPNRWYGVRTPATLADEKWWYAVNAFAGRALLVASAVSAVLIVDFPGWLPPAAAFLGPLTVALVLVLIYLRRPRH